MKKIKATYTFQKRNYNIEKVNLNLIKTKFSKFYSFVNDPKFKKISNQIIHNYKYIAYCQDQKENIVSCVLFKELIEFPYIWQLGRISTDSKYTNKGIASNLLKIIIDFIKIHNGYKLTVYVSNTNKIAQKFYRKNGFINEASIKNMKLKTEDINIFTKTVI